MLVCAPLLLLIFAPTSLSFTALWRVSGHSILRARPVVASSDDSPAVASSELSASKNPPEEVDPRHLTQWIKNAKTVPDLLVLHEKYSAGFNHIHLSASWIALSRHSRARSKASQSAKHGYTRYRAMPERLHQALMPLMRQSAEMALAGDLAGRELANVMYGIARSRIPEGAPRAGLLDVLAVSAESRIRELKPQELSNSAWAYATAGHAAPELFDALASVAVRRLTVPSADAEMSEFSPQELANLAWAYATAGHVAPELYDSLANASLGSINEFNPQNLANTAWAFATARHPAPRLFDELAICAAARSPDFNPQNLANTVLATARHGDHTCLLSAILSAC